jgi:hypothetical protein
MKHSDNWTFVGIDDGLGCYNTKLVFAVACQTTDIHKALTAFDNTHISAANTTISSPIDESFIIHGTGVFTNAIMEDGGMR